VHDNNTKHVILVSEMFSLE